MQRWCLVDTINFYRDNFSNVKFLGLLFFFFWLWVTISLLYFSWVFQTADCTSLKIIVQVHKQFVPWAKLNYKIYTSTAADTINFYRDNFSNVKFLGLLFFFFWLWVTISLLYFSWVFQTADCTSLKIIVQVHKQFVPWAKLNYKIYTSTAAYTCWITSLLPLMTSTFSTLIWQGLKKKNMNSSVSFQQAVLTCCQ